MCAKLRAAAAARQDPDLVLIARTDARGVTSLDDAIYRSQAYLAAGADWIFPEALADRDEFARFADEVDAPLVANMTEFGKSPLLPLEELADLGLCGGAVSGDDAARGDESGRSGVGRAGRRRNASAVCWT